MKVYGIGGLGVDERVFSALSLSFELTPLNWIAPLKDESLQNYAERFAKQITADEPFTIIGVSFGGMLSMELNRILSPEKVILISSAMSKADIPWLFRLMGKSGLFNLLPDVLLKPPPFVANYFFGVTEPKYQEILRYIIADTDTDFLRWAIGQIARWDLVEQPNNITRIHGSSDRLLKCSEKAFSIHQGGHFMVMDRANEVSDILNKLMVEAN